MASIADRKLKSSEKYRMKIAKIDFQLIEMQDVTQTPKYSFARRKNLLQFF